MELSNPMVAPVICILCFLLDDGFGYKPPVTETDKGKVMGKRIVVLETPVDVYYGIPFAKPPLGRLRFLHPQPNDAWTGIYNATKKPAACMQGYDPLYSNFSGAKVWDPNTTPSEDCLYLNVWVPHTRGGGAEKKSVFVWIFGGGFYSGSASLDIYDAKYLAAENDIIVVSMQYRVAALGFLALGIPEAPGNAGLFDQLLSLDWIQRNIHYFGGDPRSVTLCGESAGAVSVGLHLLSPLSRGKFNRAILESGAPQAAWSTYNEEEALRRANKMANNLRCDTRDKLRMLECFKNKTSDELGNATNYWVVDGIIQFPFIPIVDGTFLTQTPEAALKEGNFKRTPILLGSNANEGTYFLVYQYTKHFSLKTKSLINSRDFSFLLERSFHYYPSYPHKINDFGMEAIHHQYTYWHNPQDPVMNRNQIDQAVGDYHFTCNVMELAHIYATVGEKVYNYVFTHRSSAHHWPVWMGVLHADEINFVFGEPLDPSKKYNNLEQKLSRQMMKYWTNFAKTGDPNKESDGRTLNEWPAYTTDGREHLKLNVQYLHGVDKSQAIGNGYRTNECAFWRYYLPRLVAATADISDMEKDWKLQFHQWSTKYIVDWKHQFNNFMKTHDRRSSSCDRD